MILLLELKLLYWELCNAAMMHWIFIHVLSVDDVHRVSFRRAWEWDAYHWFPSFWIGRLSSSLEKNTEPMRMRITSLPFKWIYVYTYSNNNCPSFIRSSPPGYFLARRWIASQEKVYRFHVVAINMTLERARIVPCCQRWQLWRLDWTYIVLASQSILV